jgi:asparagine N-glycosylation enzyme membrane subunit Stt3
MFARSIIKIYNTLLMRLPVVNILCTSALYIWILIFTWSRAMIKRDRKLLMLVIPMLMLMLTILSGPCNGNIYHRFTYPVAMAMPIIAGYGFRKEIKSE